MIYWDHNATTPCDEGVVEAMSAFLSKDYSNPNSLHLGGRRVKGAIENSRRQVAHLLNVEPKEIFFTAGATESNNILLLSLALSSESGRKKVVVSSIEHKSILEPCKLLERSGIEVAYVPVKNDGVVDLDLAKECIDENTILVSVHIANNELGTLQPIAELSDIAHENGAFFHTDGAQVLGRIPIDLFDLEVDFASFSAHKLYGPKGVGALFCRDGIGAWPWGFPLLGGGQENGMRPGTSNVPGIVGFGKACELAHGYISNYGKKLDSLTALLTSELEKAFPKIYIFCKESKKIPGVLSFSIPDFDAASFVVSNENYAVSRGSACNSGAIEESYVLKQITLDESVLKSSVRVSMGKGSEESHVMNFPKEIISFIEKARA